MKTNLCPKAIDAASNIGEFYLQKNNGDYKLTREEIDHLKITDLSVDTEGIVTIVAARPGRLIGVRGNNITSLEEYLKQKIRIVETAPSAIDYLVPEPPWEDAEDWIDDSWIETYDDYGYMDEDYKETDHERSE